MFPQFVRDNPLWKSIKGSPRKECPICGHLGFFREYGSPPRGDAKCPTCRSLERHRLFYLCVVNNNLLQDKKKILHFAPTPVLRKQLKKVISDYVTADIDRSNVDIKLDMEQNSLASYSFDGVIANHVLGEVDWNKALAETNRILTPGGSFFGMISQASRRKEDLRLVSEKVGFEFSKLQATEEEAHRFSLNPYDMVFDLKKPEY